MAPFKPASWMWVYAQEFIRTLADGLRPVQRQVAQRAKVREETVSRAMQRPEFRAWLEGQLRQADHLMSELIRSRVAGQALAGSEKHQRLHFELQGEIGRGGLLGDGASKLGDGWTVNIGVPLTPAPDALPAIDTTATVQS